MNALEHEFLAVYDDLDPDQRFNMARTIDNMRFGADALIDPTLLNPMVEENGRSVLQPEVARHYTDQLATMVKKGFVAGPFDESPIPNLRINSLFAVNQADKYRPILNLSKPKGNNYNDAIVQAKMRKVTMSTSRQFAETLTNTGRGSIISKLDHVSAYKLVPVKKEQFYLQGFSWLGKIFIEVRLIFGAGSSVPNYDDLHQTVSDIVKIISQTDRQFLHRTLDDQVVVTPTLAPNHHFISSYLDLAKKINLPLADTSGEDKAFLYRTSGTVLGVYFNTEAMTWSYKEIKRVTHMKILNSTLLSPKVTLEQMQKVMGVINTLVIMCPTFRFLRAPLVAQLSNSYSISPLVLSVDADMFLNLWLHIFDALQHGFPLPSFVRHPPLIVRTYITDAAGKPDPTSDLGFEIGAGAAGYIDPWNKIIYVGQALWPASFLVRPDFLSKIFGRKTTLLETLAMFVPLWHNVSDIIGSHIVIKVDNIGTVWAYQKGRSKEDMFTSVIMTALNHVATYFCCKLYVFHCPRLSSEAAVFADLLTRTNKQGMDFVNMKMNTIQHGWPPSLIRWLLNPTIDWFLGPALVEDFKTALKGKVFPFLAWMSFSFPFLAGL